MMPIFFSVKLRGLPLGLPKPEWNKMLKASYGAALEYWHKEIRPGHFEETAYSKYHYQYRTRKHRIRKMKKFGHNRPMVYTGLSLLKSERFKIVSSAKKARLVMNVPALNLRRSDISPNMREELTIVTQEERRRMINVFTDTLRKQFSEYGNFNGLVEVRNTRSI